MSEGSHAVPDDVFVAVDATMIQKYLEVFKLIFVRLGHENHYNMMMGSLKVIEAAVASPPAGKKAP
jgi:wobble nucleotide-excising tRNase